MKILVTGATGFIGGRFARFALEQGLEVRISGRRPEAAEPLIRRGAEFIAGDLQDAVLLRRLCDGVDAVVHCAGAVGVWGRYEDFYRDNVTVTENVVEACLKQQVRRLVHLSSPSVYFDGKAHVGLREEQLPKRFSDHYGKTKYLAEQKVFGAQEFGLEVIALRPRFVTGAGDTAIFPRLIRMQRKGRLMIVGNGLNKVDFTSVHNLNQALFSSLLAPEAALGQVYNISNGAPLPFWDVVNYVLRQLELPAQRRGVPRLAGAPGAVPVSPGGGGDGQGLFAGYHARPADAGVRAAGQPVDCTG
jgi:nucleoside-diphosphate-sugar epimerase